MESQVNGEKRHSGPQHPSFPLLSPLLLRTYTAQKGQKDESGATSSSSFQPHTLPDETNDLEGPLPITRTYRNRRSTTRILRPSPRRGSRKTRPSVHDARTPQSHTNDLAPPFIPSKVTSPIGASCDWPLARDSGLWARRGATQTLRALHHAAIAAYWLARRAVGRWGSCRRGRTSLLEFRRWILDSVL